MYQTTRKETIGGACREWDARLSYWPEEEANGSQGSQLRLVRGGLIDLTAPGAALTALSTTGTNRRIARSAKKIGWYDAGRRLPASRGRGARLGRQS
jgi:hypothetical protein